jgi:RNAse (barnase) inhibitor barstar
MHAFTIDCAAIRDEASFWQAYVSEVRPESASRFGRNLDAFWDAVSGGGPGWPGECELRFTNSSHLGAINGGVFLAALARIARDSEFVRVVLL